MKKTTKRFTARESEVLRDVAYTNDLTATQERAMRSYLLGPQQCFRFDRLSNVVRNAVDDATDALAGLREEINRERFKVGTRVRVTSMARRDAVGRVIYVGDRSATVRLPKWQADGYHLDVTARFESLEVMR